MPSQLRTPSFELPKTDSDRRFLETDYPSEWAEAYRPGGFHPVNLGDSFKDGQYRVIRKLGYGSFSTVWLAKDHLNARYVALKVMKARASLKPEPVLSIIKRIKDHSDDSMAKHILIYRDIFQHQGPNGTHLCLVSEPMGPTAASLAEELIPSENRTYGRTIRYPKYMARIILKHTLIGLAFLHKNDIVHADLQPGNILPATSEIDALCENDLKQDQSGKNHYPKPLTLQRVDGLDDIWAPRHLYLDQSLLRYTPIDSRMLWKISDFGSAFLTQTPPKAVATPDALRAPELILGGVVNSSIDIWSFGCLVYEFLTGDTLFCVPKLGPNEEESGDDDHLLQMNDILGPLPESWLIHKWPRAKQYFGPNRERLDPNAGQNAGYQQEPYVDEPLELLFEKNKPEDMDGTETSVITSLIRSILQYEPSQRPSAAKLLDHPWFQN